MKKQWMIPLMLGVLLCGGAVGWHFMGAKKTASFPTDQGDLKNQPAKQSTSAGEEPASGFNKDAFAQLETTDQETVRDLVQKVRRLGDPQATPEDCSLLVIGDAHYALTSFWDPDYYRNPSVWKAQEQDDLWSPEQKQDIAQPGAWMIAMLTKNTQSSLPDAALRWAAPPGKMAPPEVSSKEPVAQACNAGWNELLKQNYAFFSFVKATAVQNKLQLHFTVVKANDDKPQKIAVTVPVKGTLKDWSLGSISIQEE